MSWKQLIITRWVAYDNKYLSLTGLEARSPKSRIVRVVFCPNSIEKKVFPCFFQLLVVPGTPISAPVFLSYFCVFSSLSLIRTFGMHPDNPGWVHLKVLQLITSVKTLLQIRSHSQRVGHGHIFWGHHSTYYRQP